MLMALLIRLNSISFVNNYPTVVKYHYLSKTKCHIVMLSKYNL